MRTLLFVLLMSFSLSAFADKALCNRGSQYDEYVGVYSGTSVYEHYYIFHINGTVYYFPTSQCILVRSK